MLPYLEQIDSLRDHQGYILEKVLIKKIQDSHIFRQMILHILGYSERYKNISDKELSAIFSITYNSNWESRHQIYDKIENNMKNNDFDKAREIYFENPGSLKVSQYTQIRDNYINRIIKNWIQQEDIQKILKNEEYEKFDEVFYKEYKNEDFRDKYNFKKAEFLNIKKDEKIEEIKSFLDKGEFKKADILYNSNRELLCEFDYEGIREVAFSKIKSLHINRLQELLMHHKGEGAKNYYNKYKNYITEEEFNKIKEKLYEEQRKKVLKNYMKELENFNYRVAEEIHLENKNYITDEEHLRQVKKTRRNEIYSRRWYLKKYNLYEYINGEYFKKLKELIEVLKPKLECMVSELIQSNPEKFNNINDLVRFNYITPKDKFLLSLESNDVIEIIEEIALNLINAVIHNDWERVEISSNMMPESLLDRLRKAYLSKIQKNEFSEKRHWKRYKKDYKLFKVALEQLKEKYGFNGLYHFTDFSNLALIFKDGYLRSRNECKYNGISFIDGASRSVMGHTSEYVKECVRFYYRPKTPTLYVNEGIKLKKYMNSNPHIPIPVYLVFDEELIYLDTTQFTDGNAGSYDFNPNADVSFFHKIDWAAVFHDTVMNESEKNYIKNKRHAELLSSIPVSLDYLKRIVFRCKTDLKRAINLFGKGDRYDIDLNLFSNKNLYLGCKPWEENNFIKNYRIISSKELRSFNFLVLELCYQRSYGHYETLVVIKDKENKMLKKHIMGEDLIAFTEDHCSVKVIIKGIKSNWYKLEVYLNGILCIEEYLEKYR